MMSNRTILQELDLPVYVLRAAERVLPVHSFIVLVEETQAAFGSLHQTQLEKIMQYLNQPAYLLLFSDSDLNCQAEILLQFGAHSTALKARQVTQTHSISKMLADPSSKKQVLHDLQSLKSG